MSADSVTAAERLRTLDTYHRTPIRGAQAVRAAPSSIPGTPVSIGMLDYLDRTGDEIDQLAARDEAAARAVDPTLLIAPKPAALAARYEWWESIPVPDQAREDDRARVIYRQGLEHAIREGDTKVVRKHPCPACGCYTLMWARRGGNVAVCPNLRCVDADGMSHTWTLTQIADHHILAERMLKNRATS